MSRLLPPALLVLALTLAGPAQAHKLKVFATVEAGTIKGYAFFIGGGRAQNTPWIAQDAAGTRITQGDTDDEGRFAFALPPSLHADVTVTVDTHEGHIASATVAATRFGALAPEPAATTAASLPGTAPPADVSSAMDSRLAALVEVAVQRQVEPLMEQIERMDSRLRFADVLSGLFLILGLAGMVLWARGRRP